MSEPKQTHDSIPKPIRLTVSGEVPLRELTDLVGRIAFVGCVESNAGKVEVTLEPVPEALKARGQQP